MAAILDYHLQYAGFFLNDHKNANGVLDQSKVNDCYLVDQFDFSRLRIRDQREGFHTATGSDVGVATEVERFISILGQIRALSGESLEDKIATLMHVFDIEEAQLAAPTSQPGPGVQQLVFLTPTLAPPSGLVSPVQEIFFCRPSAHPAVFERRSTGDTAAFAVELVCPDPRRYLNPAESIPVAGAPVTLPNWTVDSGRQVFPIVTVVLSGAGSATFQLIGPKTLTLDLSAETAGTFTIDMFKQSIKKGATWKDYTLASGINSFWGIPAGGTTVTGNNLANVTSITFAYRQARA